MTLHENIVQILSDEQVFIDEPMCKHTTFRVGGPADFYLRPQAEQLPNLMKLLFEQKEPFLIIGNGSNLLVGDKGVRGVVIEIGKQMQDIKREGAVIRVGAGALLSKTAAFAARESLTGLEFASGIPGTLGGAIVMNAGAYGGEMKQVVHSVQVMTRQGKIKTLLAEEMDFAYRHSCIIENKYIVLSAELKLQTGRQEEIMDEIDRLKEQRISKQPLEYPSAGSTFKRPAGYFAGKLIMDSGLRGCQVGGAQISEKHCGFVINKEQASASDICRLIEQVQEKVYDNFGVKLETEVKFVGEF